MLTVQEFPSALSVPTTLAARPLSARSLLRTLRLALRDGGGRAGTGSGAPSITLAFAPASRCASICWISSIPRSSCSSVFADFSNDRLGRADGRHQDLPAGGRKARKDFRYRRQTGELGERFLRCDRDCFNRT